MTKLLFYTKQLHKIIMTNFKNHRKEYTYLKTYLYTTRISSSIYTFFGAFVLKFPMNIETIRTIRNVKALV